MRDFTDIFTDYILHQRGVLREGARGLTPPEIKKYLDIAASNMKYAKEIMNIDRKIGKEMMDTNQRLWDSMNNLMDMRRGVKGESLSEAVSKSPVEFWITYHYGDGPGGQDLGPTPMQLYSGRGAEGKAKADAKKLDFGYEKIQVSLPRRDKK